MSSEQVDIKDNTNESATTVNENDEDKITMLNSAEEGNGTINKKEATGESLTITETETDQVKSEVNREKSTDDYPNEVHTEANKGDNEISSELIPVNQDVVSEERDITEVTQEAANGHNDLKQESEEGIEFDEETQEEGDLVRGDDHELTKTDLKPNVVAQETDHRTEEEDDIIQIEDEIDIGREKKAQKVVYDGDGTAEELGLEDIDLELGLEDIDLRLAEEESDMNLAGVEEAHHFDHSSVHSLSLQESMMTQSGSFGSSADLDKSLTVISEDENLPRNFQDYVKQYSQLFTKTSDSRQEEHPCKSDTSKAFLKIDMNELISGFKKENTSAADPKKALAGMTRVKGNLLTFEDELIVLRSDYKQYKGVRILSGGRMGNEPLYIDYVGNGLLTGIVLGSISDPPNVFSVTKAMRELVKDSPGLLIIIQNNVEYRLIFGLAMERIRMEGYHTIDMVAVSDDCFERCKSPAGRRGLAGIVLLFKLAGSMADCLRPLRDIYTTVRSASKSLITISCMTRPFKAIGTGLDKGSKDGVIVNGSISQMVKKMIDYCLHPLRYFSMRLDPEDRVIVLINSYRSKNPDFYITVEHVLEELENRSVNVERVYAENFVTGFWPGFSISMMVDCNNYMAKNMDSPTSSSLWRKNATNGKRRAEVFPFTTKTSFPDMGPILEPSEAQTVKTAVETACKAIILCEYVLNTMHFFGNYGTKLRIGAEAVLQQIRQSQLRFDRPFNLLIDISETLIGRLPGVTGVMYGCLFEGAARSFLRSPLTTVSGQNWTEAMDEALKTLRAYTNAKGGIVSLALSLIPVVTALHGPFINLMPKAKKNPILAALDSLRNEIEERMKTSGNEKESILKNQIDVESYALIIWLHAVYSSIFWKTPSNSKKDDESQITQDILKGFETRRSNRLTDSLRVNRGSHSKLSRKSTSLSQGGSILPQSNEKSSAQIKKSDGGLLSSHQKRTAKTSEDKTSPEKLNGSPKSGNNKSGTENQPQINKINTSLDFIASMDKLNRSLTEVNSKDQLQSKLGRKSSADKSGVIFS